ncbi:hypothetical protein M422DRAFT_273445 [Sphaerobolus stellatus SS14]|uniref:Uncharacterized protein n=1 Tax=Sphaerobolus stellatus (strain SS14) TaxID=990650 RepID=A0A0C9TUR1_SPHS4|nr:hypothetical protein M422DRAFT_273445 [Sphaerobolus stellatus SS14]
MPYRQPITDEQLAPFLEAAKSMMIPADNVPPPVVEEVLAPSKSSNPLLLEMNRNLIAQTIKLNTNNAMKYEERKELWYPETAIAVYLDVKRKAEEAVAKKTEEDAKAAAKAVEEENECVMDANSEGEDEVDQEEMLKLKLKSTKLHPIVDLESEEETKEVKAKRRKAKGKGKVMDTEFKRNMVPYNYVGFPGVPASKMCEGCKVPRNAKYRRPCVGNIIMDADNQIFLVSEKECCFVCVLQSNVCSFTCDEEADFIMPEVANDEELQAKLRKLCDEQDTFQKQKDKERVERNKRTGNSTKAGTNTKVEVNMKASGSTLKRSKQKVVSEEDDIEVTSQLKRARTRSKQKVVSEEDDIEVTSQLKRARMVTNSAGSSGRVPSVTESLQGINQALIKTINILGDTRAASKAQSKTLRGIKTCMANLQSAMQMNWAAKDEEDRESCEVEDDETMKDPEADEL